MVVATMTARNTSSLSPSSALKELLDVKRALAGWSSVGF
jgi:hypothetical protein